MEFKGTKIYEFVTPSDAITFRAENDMIAFMVCLFLGEGKAGCHKENGESINTMTAFIFNEDARKEVYREYCGTDDLQSVFDENISKVVNSLKSFSYGSISDRKQYDDAIEAITDPAKLKEFQNKHEDRNRTSTSKWVSYAWETAKALGKEADDE